MPRKTDPKNDAYKAEFARKTYDAISLYVPKGKREKIRAHGAERGESVNAFINRAIRETMRRDKKGEGDVSEED